MVVVVAVAVLRSSFSSRCHVHSCSSVEHAEVSTVGILFS